MLNAHVLSEIQKKKRLKLNVCHITDVYGFMEYVRSKNQETPSNDAILLTRLFDRKKWEWE